MGRLGEKVDLYYEGQCTKQEIFAWTYIHLDEMTNVDDVLVVLPDSLMDEFIGDLINIDTSKTYEFMWSSGVWERLPHATVAIKKWCDKAAGLKDET
jgi:hypothetical protein